MRKLPFAVALAGCALLAGCSAGDLGVAGLASSTDGSVSIVVAWCGRTPSDLLITTPGADAAHPVHVVDFTAHGLKGDVDSIPLSGSQSPRWRPQPADFTLDPKVEYTATAVTSDRGYNTTSVEFTLDELPALTAEEVLISVPNDDGTDSSPKVISRSTFTSDGKAVCEHNNGP